MNYGDYANGILGTLGKQFLKLEALIPWLIVLVCFLALAEAPKVLLRKNIGRKALNIYAIIGASAFYLFWAFVCLCILGAICVLFVYNIQQNGANALSNGLVYIFGGGLTLGGFLAVYAMIFYCKLTFKVLFRGMDEYFRANAENSQDFRVLEFRGDNPQMAGLLNQGWSRELIWRVAEPKSFLKMASNKCANPLIGLPLVLTGYLFWISEWYHVHYKIKRMKESFLNMKIEMQKSTQLYNLSQNSLEITRVKTD